jgi:hypothetical protein
MTATLLAVRIKVTNFYGLAAAFLPLNRHINVVHIYLPSQRKAEGPDVFKTEHSLTPQNVL